MNKYEVQLNGCGDDRTKTIQLELTPEDARRLNEWNLDYLDCCGGPSIEVTPIKDTEK